MSHVSSITNSSYPYRGTLSRLDTNGDGVLSREELAAGDRPGLLETDLGNNGDSDQNTALGNLMAVLMQVPANGGGVAEQARISLMLPGSSAGSAATAQNISDPELQVAMDAYRGTYGQYDLNDVAA